MVFLALVFSLSLAGLAAAQEPTTTTSTSSSTTTLPLTTPEVTVTTPEVTATTPEVTATTVSSLTATTLPPAAPVASGTSIRSGAKNIILDNLNLILDTASNYKRDRFLLSRNYSTYIKLIRDSKGKDSAISKSIYADINLLEKRSLPESELQLDKLLKDLRNYVQDLN
jgi:hypothetical protein